MGSSRRSRTVKDALLKRQDAGLIQQQKIDNIHASLFFVKACVLKIIISPYTETKDIRYQHTRPCLFCFRAILNIGHVKKSKGQIFCPAGLPAGGAVGSSDGTFVAPTAVAGAAAAEAEEVNARVSLSASKHTLSKVKCGQSFKLSLPMVPLRKTTIATLALSTSTANTKSAVQWVESLTGGAVR